MANAKVSSPQNIDKTELPLDAKLATGVTRNADGQLIRRSNRGTPEHPIIVEVQVHPADAKVGDE